MVKSNKLRRIQFENALKINRIKYKCPTAGHYILDNLTTGASILCFPSSNQYLDYLSGEYTKYDHIGKLIDYVLHTFKEKEQADG